MGCIHGKCCSWRPKTSDGGKREELGVYPGQNAAHRSLDVVDVPSHGFRLAYSVLTQRGYYPETPDKENQDSYCVKTNIQDNPNVHFFGVFDGHGMFGTQCSNFVKNRLVEIMLNDAALLDDPVKAFSTAFLTTNDELHKSEIDDSMSGTTAVTALVVGDKLYVANVGDSRAVLAVKEGNTVLSQDLSYDQTPFRKDECDRVKLCGARVLSVDQVEGLKDPQIQSWGDEETAGGDPPRLWVQNGMYPGTAFTRSVGDSTAEKIGVVADPEVSMIQLTSNHPFFVVASDGVFEFLSSQTVVDMVNKYDDPRDACSAIAGESYKLWLEHENRTDDITIILVHIKDLTNLGVNAKNGRGEESYHSGSLKMEEESPDTYLTPPGSEAFRSVNGSDYFETQSFQPFLSIGRSSGGSMDRIPEAVVACPPPALVDHIPEVVVACPPPASVDRSPEVVACPTPDSVDWSLEVIAACSPPASADRSSAVDCKC